jgi:hypothetical protein
MVQAPLQAALSGPTLVRLLARLAEADVSEPQASLADRLSQWLGWTDAIALSTALSTPPGTPLPRAGAGVAPTLDREDASLVVTARSALTKMITRACAPAKASANANPQHGSRESAEANAPISFAEFRQDYLSIQQAMETEVGQLRKRLRTQLAARTPALARLAAVDAIMERSLGPREQRLLASVPALLATYFERLQRAAQQVPDEAASTNEAPAAPGTWLATFRKEMQSVLLAELDIRFQPVQGLLAALRAR